VNPDPRLAELEASIMASVNNLEIGAMGFGGNVTLIGCKIGVLNRLPASFFVSVAYDCWAFRRLGVSLNAATGAIEHWLYRDPSHPIIPMLDQAGFTRTGHEVALQAPLSEEQSAIAQGRRPRSHLGPCVHGRDASCALDEARAARGPARVGAYPAVRLS
jgi:fumarate hydratase class I